MKDDVVEDGSERRGLSRRSLLAGAGAIAGTALIWSWPQQASALEGSSMAGAVGTSLPAEWDSTSRAILEEWANNRTNHTYLPDFGQAGYRNGLPTPGSKLAKAWPNNVSVRDFGAVGDGVTDDYQAIMSAIDAAPKETVVEIPAGRFLVSRPLVITRNDVAIRGAGRDATTLYFPNTVQSALGRPPQDTGPISSYSWSGGQVWFSPQGHLDGFFGRSKWTSECWEEGATPIRVVEDAPRGATALRLATTVGIKAGDRILLRLEADPEFTLFKAMCGNVPGADTYDWGGWPSGWIAPGDRQFPEWRAYLWPVKVTGINGTLVSIAEPTHLPVRAAWKPRVSVLHQYTSNVGIERLTIENKLIPQTAHNMHPGSNGVYFAQVIDGWARDVAVVNVDLGFGLTSSKHVTIHNVEVRGRASHHPYACRMQSHNNVVQHFAIRKPTVPPVASSLYHGVNVEGYSSGNVFRQGVMEHGIFDSHKGLPFDTLRTSIVTANVGLMGGGDAGPAYGCRFVHWGITGANGITPGADVGGKTIHIDDAAPSSLVLGTKLISGGSATNPTAAIPSPRNSRRELVGTLPVPADLYLAQRKIRGWAMAEPNPL